MPDDPQLQALIDRLRHNDPAAAEEVFHHFVRRLVGLARTRLDSWLRQKVDPEDVAQSVFKSFFVRHAAGQFEVHSWDGLWGLLTTITLRKCGLLAEFWGAAKRNPRRETASPLSDSDSAVHFEPMAREPTPSEVAMLTESVERLMNGLDERSRQVVHSWLDGNQVAAISTQLACSERMVYRIIKLARQRLDQLIAETAD